MAETDQVTEPGKKCWRIERASRLALTIDAERYFVAFKEPILAAKQSVYLIGIFLIGWTSKRASASNPRVRRLRVYQAWAIPTVDRQAPSRTHIGRMLSRGCDDLKTSLRSSALVSQTVVPAPVLLIVPSSASRLVLGVRDSFDNS